MSGISALGFEPATVDEIRQLNETDLKATIDPALDLDPDQPFGQINGALSATLARLQEELQLAYLAQDPNSAEGIYADHIAGLTGTIRLPARRSEVLCSVNLNAGTTLNPTNAIANVVGQPARTFRIKAPFTSPSTGVHSVLFESTSFGPIPANAGTLTVITAPVSGWNSITNPSDATLGRAEEQDSELLTRRELELTAGGASNVDALRSDILQTFAGRVKFCEVFENTTFVTDGAGLPGKAFEVVIHDPAPGGPVPNTEIAQAIWKAKGSGGASHGSVSANAVDSNGVSRLVYFSRATLAPVYFDMVVQINPNTFPSAGIDLIKDALLLEAAKLKLGSDVNSTKFKAAVLTVPGVVDFTFFALGLAPGPIGTATIPIPDRTLATLISGNISVFTFT